MPRFRFFLVILMCLLPLHVAYGQESIPDKMLKGDIISIDTATEALEKCLNSYPEGFTPKSHKQFCHCSAANIRLYMTNSELVELNKKLVKKAGNEVFEKYIQKVVSPCMEFAIPDIAYVACLEDRSHNPYIRKILPYCRCTAHQMKKFVRSQGASSIIINMTSNPTFYKDPRTTLLMSNEHNIALYQAYGHCHRYGLEDKNRL